MYHTYVNVDYRKIAVGLAITMLLVTMLFAAMPVAVADNIYEPFPPGCDNDPGQGNVDSDGLHHAGSPGFGVEARGPVLAETKVSIVICP